MADPVGTVAALLALFKRKYVEKDLSNQGLIRSPFFRTLPRYDDLTGEGIYIPYNYGLPPNGSASYAKAQTNIAASNVARWFVERKEYHASHTIDSEAIFASRGKEAAFLSAKEKEVNEQLKSLSQQFAVHAWGSGTGVLGRTSTDPGTGSSAATITLTDPRDAAKLMIGMYLGACADATGGTQRTDIYKVTRINRKTGVITMDRTTGSSNDWAANDYVFQDGNYDAVVNGVQAWIPSADPATTLLGMTRTDDPVMKAGWRGDDEGSIEESALALCADMGQYFNDAASGLWLSRYNWFRLERELESKNRKVVDSKASEYFGTPALVLLTPEGEIPVMADPFCPSDAGFLLDHSSWEIHHMEGLPHVVVDDGLTAVRTGDTSPGIKIQFRAWWEVVCFRPFSNGRFPIS